MIIQYRKARCDKCGREKAVEGAGILPFGWLCLSLTQMRGLMGNTILTKEVCGKKCAVALMNKIRIIPKSKETVECETMA